MIAKRILSCAIHSLLRTDAPLIAQLLQLRNVGRTRLPAQRSRVLPAGDYATLSYREHDVRANRALLEWVRANSVQLDRSDDPSGDRFACRYETYLTDPWTERRKKKWTIQLNMRVREDVEH